MYSIVTKKLSFLQALVTQKNVVYKIVAIGYIILESANGNDLVRVHFPCHVNVLQYRIEFMLEFHVR